MLQGQEGLDDKVSVQGAKGNVQAGEEEQVLTVDVFHSDSEDQEGDEGDHQDPAEEVADEDQGKDRIDVFHACSILKGAGDVKDNLAHFSADESGIQLLSLARVNAVQVAAGATKATNTVAKAKGFLVCLHVFI